MCVWEEIKYLFGSNFSHLRFRRCAFSSFFFFFVYFFSRNFWPIPLCTVHWSHKLYFSITFSLKIGHTTLSTHLKIILLQCFQFSVKISCIQTDPKNKNYFTIQLIFAIIHGTHYIFLALFMDLLYYFN